MKGPTPNPIRDKYFRPKDKKPNGSNGGSKDLGSGRRSRVRNGESSRRRVNREESLG